MINVIQQLQLNL